MTSQLYIFSYFLLRAPIKEVQGQMIFLLHHMQGTFTRSAYNFLPWDHFLLCSLHMTALVPIDQHTDFMIQIQNILALALTSSLNSSLECYGYIQNVPQKSHG